VVLLAFVMLPLVPLPRQGIMYAEHPLADEWAWEWLLAKQGWWGATLDNRWAQSPDELALNDVLRAEIRAGRITTDTHIVHVTPNTIMSRTSCYFALYRNRRRPLHRSAGWAYGEILREAGCIRYRCYLQRSRNNRLISSYTVRLRRC